MFIRLFTPGVVLAHNVLCTGNDHSLHLQALPHHPTSSAMGGLAMPSAYEGIAVMFAVSMPIFAGPLLASTVSEVVQINSIRINCNGSMVCAVGSRPGSGGCQDSRLFVYSTELNGSIMFDFAKDWKAPWAAYWDLRDPRLLSVQTCPLAYAQDGSCPDSRAGSDEGSSNTGTASGGGTATDALAATAAPSAADNSMPTHRGVDVAVMFATADAGLLLQEYQNVEQIGASGFLGVCAPHLLLHKKTLISTPGAPPHSSNITRLPLLGFSGLGDADDATRHALLDFNYYLAVGRLDEAFKAVAALHSPAVWRSMAHMAIKNKRLDVAGE